MISIPIYLSYVLNTSSLLFRVVSAVYEMMGTESSNLGKARELFSKMDENSDGLVR